MKDSCCLHHIALTPVILTFMQHKLDRVMGSLEAMAHLQTWSSPGWAPSPCGSRPPPPAGRLSFHGGWETGTLRRKKVKKGRQIILKCPFKPPHEDINLRCTAINPFESLPLLIRQKTPATG